MSLKAGAANKRTFTLHDANGEPLAGEAGNFTLALANESGSVSPAGVLSIGEVAGHPAGVYTATLDLTSHPAEQAWHARITNDTTGFTFVLRGVADSVSADTALARKALLNRLEVDPSGDAMKLYDDDDSILQTFTVKDKDGGSIGFDKQVPARRSKGV